MKQTGRILLLTLLVYATAAASEPKVEIHRYMTDLAASTGSPEAVQLSALTDPAKLNEKMTSDQMSDYIKATRFQSRMVYFYSAITGGNEKGLMTPLEFVRSLTDDLFQRKGLSPMVNRKQKEGLILHKEIMEMGAAGECLAPPQLDSLVLAFKQKTFKQ